MEKLKTDFGPYDRPNGDTISTGETATISPPIPAGSTTVHGMTEPVIKNLEKAKKANPHWFGAMNESASTMVNRRAKYSGDHDNDPYTNFIKVARISGDSVQDVLRQDIARKMARLEVAFHEEKIDFADESFDDALIDVANYALLLWGWRMRSSQSQKKAIDSVK